MNDILCGSFNSIEMNSFILLIRVSLAGKYLENIILTKKILQNKSGKLSYKSLMKILEQKITKYLILLERLKEFKIIVKQNTILQ